MSDKVVSIYGLIDPRVKQDPINIRYIGKTNDPKRRYKDHIKQAKRGDKSAVYNWIRKLLNDGIKPNIIIIDKCTVNHWSIYEQSFIYWFRLNSTYELLNILDGGDSPPVNGGEVKKRKICKYSLDGNLLHVYNYVRQINNDGINHCSVIMSIKNSTVDGVGYCKGFLWKYVDDQPEQKIISYDIILKIKKSRPKQIKKRKRISIKKCKRKTFYIYKPDSITGCGRFKRFTFTNKLYTNERLTIVVQTDMLGNVVNRFDSIAAAAKQFNSKKSNNRILETIKGYRSDGKKRLSYKGYYWKLDTEPKEEKQIVYCNPCDYYFLNKK